jgi:hypothetical protein
LVTGITTRIEPKKHDWDHNQNRTKKLENLAEEARETPTTEKRDRWERGESEEGSGCVFELCK